MTVSALPFPAISARALEQPRPDSEPDPQDSEFGREFAEAVQEVGLQAPQAEQEAEEIEEIKHEPEEEIEPKVAMAIVAAPALLPDLPVEFDVLPLETLAAIVNSGLGQVVDFEQVADIAQDDFAEVEDLPQDFGPVPDLPPENMAMPRRPETELAFAARLSGEAQPETNHEAVRSPAPGRPANTVPVLKAGAEQPQAAEPVSTPLVLPEKSEPEVQSQVRAHAVPTEAVPAPQHRPAAEAAPVIREAAPARVEGIEPRQPAPAVRDISLQVSETAQERVNIRVLERGGEVRVAVRTGDAELTQGLRNNLSDLVVRLENSGYRTEVWRPQEPASSDNGAERHGSQEQHQPQRHGNGRQPEQPRWLQEMETMFGTETNPRGVS